MIRRRNSNKIIVVGFHRISDENSPAYPPIPVKVFERLVKYLNKKYSIISLYDIEKANESKKERLVLTFDDAFSDFKDNALPILKKYQLPSVLNAITACLDTGETFWTQKLNKIVEWYYFNNISIQHSLLNTKEILLNKRNVEKVSVALYQKLLPIEEKIRDKIINDLARKYKIDIEQSMLNWQELEYCKANNVIIGNHTMNHVNLTTLTQNDLNKEIRLSSNKFTDNLTFVPDILAFPNGQYDDLVIDECKRNNYKYLLTTENSSFIIVNSENSSSLLIPRIDLHSKTLWKNILRLRLYSRNKKYLTSHVSKKQKHYSCLSCKSKIFNRLLGYEKDYLIKCQSCGLVFSQKIPTHKELVQYYEDTYTRDDYLSPITIKRYNEVLDKFEKYRKTNKLLDLGSGIGYFLEVAKQRGWEIYGTEFTDDAVAICESKGAIMHQGPLNTKNYKAEMFDVITSFEVIEHINNPSKELPEYIEILRKGGVFYFTTPNFNSIERHILKGKYSAIKYPEHLSYYTKKTINFLLNKKGFSKVKLEATGFSLSRIRHTLRSNKPFRVTATYDDEMIRQGFERNWLLRLLKSIINNIFNILNIGNSLKGLYVKR